MAKPNKQQLAVRQRAIVAFIIRFPADQWPTTAQEFAAWQHDVIFWTKDKNNGVPQRQRDYIQSVFKEAQTRIAGMSDRARKFLKLPLFHLEHLDISNPGAPIRIPMRDVDTPEDIPNEADHA